MGTEAFWVPTVAALVSGGAEYANNKQAQNRQEASQVQAMQNQDELEQKAAGQTRAVTQQIAANKPDQIEAKATGDYVKQLRTNAANATPAVAGASSRYKADTAKAEQDVSDYGTEKAGEMGALDATVRQRQNEGLAMQTLGTNINLLNAQSFAKNFVDQLRAQAAGVPNAGVSLASGLVNAGARNYMGGVKAPTNPYAQVSAGGYDGFGNPLWAGGDRTGAPS